MNTPRPHHGEPGGGDGIADDSSSVDTAIVWICVKHAVADEDDAEKGKGIDGTRETAVVCKDAGDSDCDDTENRYREVKELRRRDVPGDGQFKGILIRHNRVRRT